MEVEIDENAVRACARRQALRAPKALLLHRSKKEGAVFTNYIHEYFVHLYSNLLWRKKQISP